MAGFTKKGKDYLLKEAVKFSVHQVFLKVLARNQPLNCGVLIRLLPSWGEERGVDGGVDKKIEWLVMYVL